MRNLGKVASPFLLILALALSSSCGLNPPENLKLGGPSALPDGDACPDGAELREEKDTNIELPAGGGLKVALGYAVMCGRSSDERFVKDGLFMGWGQDGELAVKGQFSRGTPSGSWELLFPSGQTLAAFNLAGGKVSALGEYFDEEGEPTPAPSLIDADTIGGSGAYTTFLERFENTPQAGLARQRLATARFKESGHFITKRINISGWGGMASYIHLAKARGGCTMEGWDANTNEECKIYDVKCRTLYGSHRSFQSCSVKKAFFENLRGVAARPAKCKKSSHYRFPYNCTIDPTDAPLVNGVKEGIWIDFPEGGAGGGCEWGLYKEGARDGLWIRWDKCYRYMDSDTGALSVAVEKNKKIYKEWWSEELMNEKIASLPAPDAAFDYVDGIAKAVDPKEVMASMGEFKKKKQMARVQESVDKCLEGKPLKFQLKERKGRRHSYKPLDPKELSKTTPGTMIQVNEQIGKCMSTRSNVLARMSADHLALRCKEGNARACLEERWTGFDRGRGTKYKDEKERVQFAKELDKLCASGSELAPAACVRLKNYIRPLFSKKDRKLEAAIAKADTLASKKPSDANDKKLDKLLEKEEALDRSRRLALKERACEAGLITHCLMAGKTAHDAGKHKTANALFKRGCEAGAEGLCGYDSKKLAAVEAQLAKDKAAKDARYETRCIEYPNGDFECKKVLKGSRSSGPSKQCTMCQSVWLKECKKRRLTEDLCTKVISSNCAAYCN